MSIKTSTKSSTSSGTVGVIDLRGSLIGDGDTDELRAVVADFLEQGIRRLIFDLRRLNYINSTGIGAVISAYARFRTNGGEIVLVGLSGGVQNILAITKLVDVFEIRDTIDEAIESFNVKIP